jgi:ribonucleoside-diphosphate reductase beta chain
MSSIFKKREHLKPYEYPELVEYVDAVRHSYWVHTEFKFTSDVQDFHVGVTDAERNAIKNTMLAIAQIEVAVKTFWGDVYKRMPKPTRDTWTQQRVQETV